MEFKKAHIIFLCALVGLSILVSCTDVEDPEPDAEPNFSSPFTNYTEPVSFLVLSSMAIDVEYSHVNESHPIGFSCSQSVETFTTLFEGLELWEDTYIVGRDFDIPCDQLEEDITSWYIDCKIFTPSVGGSGPAWFPAYMTYFYYTVDKLRWDEKEYIGWYSQVVEVEGHFYCHRFFRVTDAELTFVRW